MTSGSEVLRTKSRYCDLSSIRPNPVLGPPDLCFASAVDRKDRGGEASAATGDVAFFRCLSCRSRDSTRRKCTEGRCKLFLCLQLFRYSNRWGRAILDFPPHSPLDQSLIRRRDFPVSETQQIVMGGTLHVGTHSHSPQIVNAVVAVRRKQFDAAINQGVAT